MYQTFKLFSVGFKTSCITFFCFAPTVSIPHIWDTLTFSDGFQTPCIAFFYFTLTVSKPHVSDFLYCSDGFRTSGLGYFNFSPVVSKLLVSDSPTLLRRYPNPLYRIFQFSPMGLNSLYRIFALRVSRPMYRTVLLYSDGFQTLCYPGVTEFKQSRYMNLHMRTKTVKLYNLLSIRKKQSLFPGFCLV